MDCLFCKIVKGEIPSYRVYEDDDFLAFLDIYPHAKGHVLVIPKKHYQWTYDIPNFGAYWEVAKKVGKKIMPIVGADWMNFVTHGEIPHAHIHVLPRKGELDGATKVMPDGIHMTNEELSALARQIADTLS